MMGKKIIQSGFFIITAVLFSAINVSCVSDGRISTVYGNLEYRSSESFDGIVKQCQFQMKEKHKELQIGYKDFSLESGEIIVRLENLDTEEEVYIAHLTPKSSSYETRLLSVEPGTSFNLTIEGNNATNGGIRVCYRAEE
ncbi:MAG: hypothetical protein JW976_01625 [Syntrophaceae bacterium]|nr:hypothetical protein [Syntrophaceae bacterium]